MIWHSVILTGAVAACCASAIYGFFRLSVARDEYQAYKLWRDRHPGMSYDDWRKHH